MLIPSRLMSSRARAVSRVAYLDSCCHKSSVGVTNLARRPTVTAVVLDILEPASAILFTNQHASRNPQHGRDWVADGCGDPGVHMLCCSGTGAHFDGSKVIPFPTECAYTVHASSMHASDSRYLPEDHYMYRPAWAAHACVSTTAALIRLNAPA